MHLFLHSFLPDLQKIVVIIIIIIIVVSLQGFLETGEDKQNGDWQNQCKDSIIKLQFEILVLQNLGKMYVVCLYASKIYWQKLWILELCLNSAEKD